ncbi:tetratricopeptide repeat protein [Aestuariivivens sediminis]|uniref:tetratricopeptide repeat protein n=1 Tax=Aestuariivivens sediminis TaxID=2913557 RepID=UPI001F56FAFC|nr:tetratricopeptide repeat protein [Aestuariivivens sediminis]
MRKQIIIALAFSMSVFTFAQKKELRNAEKAIKSNNYAEAKAALNEAKTMMSDMDEDNKAKYHFLLGQALYAGGAGSIQDIDQAIENFNMAGDEYGSEIAEIKQKMTNDILTKGNKAYEANDFKGASNYFEHAYRTSPKDTLFLYYAAATSVNVQDFDRALKLYEELKDLGYTGVSTEYFATNKETGEEEILDKNTRDLYVKAGSHENPGERKTESKKAEIVKNVALIYVNQGNDEKALAAMQDARAESPDDINLILSEANVHYKMGNVEKFKSLLEKATVMDPKNPELQYNLGVISSESDDIASAQKYYKKAIELDPNYVNAYINLAALVLSREEPLIEEMNGLGTSKADDKRYEELKEERQQLYRDAIPYLSKALEIDGKNINAAKTLMNIYSVTGDTENYKILKTKVESLEAE